MAALQFIDTNILIYAHDGGAGRKHAKSVELLTGFVESGAAALSTQVLAEFYSAATRKLGISSQEAESIIADMVAWAIHRPTHADLLLAARLQRRHKVSHRLTMWDAMILQSAASLGCNTVWTEDLSAGQRYGTVTVRNPFV